MVSDYDEYRETKSGSFTFADKSEKEFDTKLPFVTFVTNYERKVSEAETSQEQSEFDKEMNFFKVNMRDRSIE